MYHLRLKKALSYRGVVSATKDAPDVFVDDKAAAEAALSSGYFDLIKAPDDKKEPESKQTEGNAVDYEKLGNLTKAELIKFAEENEIDIKDCKTKGDILEEISAFYGGSYTMMELQKGE